MSSLSSFESLENLAFLVFFNQVFLSCKQEKGMKFQCAEWQDKREIEKSMLMMMMMTMMMMKWWWKDECVLGRIRFTCSECGNVKTCMLNVSNKWIILCCLSLLSVYLLNFVSIDYRKWLPSKKLFKFYLFLVSLGQVYFVFVLTLNNHKARNRYPEMVTARPGWDGL